MAITIDLLRHPYPYKCSFTICNDCDHYTKESFQTIHEFINTTEQSKFGKGLGLPIADSLFMYGQRRGSLAYFNDVHGVPGEDSEFLIDAVKEGWIDTLHAYGDFIRPNVFSRKLAEKALNELEKRNVKFKIWVDHGSADNTQNLNTPNIISKGDKPSQPAYHADLLTQYGVVFVAGYNSDRIGQNGVESFWADPICQPNIPLSFIKRWQGRVYGKRLQTKKKYGDKSWFYSFCRGRNGVLRPDSSLLSQQLSEENIQKLIKSEGILVLYQHLGAVNKRPSYFPYLDMAARSALSHVAEKYQDGIIWVAPTSKLLTYAYLLANIQLEIVDNTNALLIEIRLKDNALKIQNLTLLADLSFRIRNYSGDTKIIIKPCEYILEENEYSTVVDDGLIIKLHPMSVTV